MALSAKVGNFALNTSTGNQSVTGVGFQPEIVLFLGTENTTDGVAVDQNWLVSAAISSTERATGAPNDEDNQATTDTSKAFFDTACIRIGVPGSSSTQRVVADLVSMDADGFTINISSTQGTAHRIGYLALAGTDLTNVAIGSFNPSGSTGNQSVTGVGFQPDAVMFLHLRSALNAQASHHYFSLGFAVSSSERAVISTASQNSVATSSSYRHQRTDSCILGLSSSSGSIYGRADLVSMDADGFTVDWLSNATATHDVVYIAFKGGQYYVGSLTTQTSTGNFSETGVGFQGSAGIFASFQNASSGSSVTGLKGAFGIATDSSNRYSIGGVVEDNQATSDSDQYTDDALVYQSYDHAQVATGAIDFVSWDSDGFTLNQTDDDPSAYQMIYFIIGAEAVAGADTITPMARRHRDRVHHMIVR